MNAQMDAPTQGLGMPRRPNQWTLSGDIALSFAMHAGDFASAKVLLDLILLAEPLNHVDIVISIMGGKEALPEMEFAEFEHKARSFFRSVAINSTQVLRPDFSEGENRDWRPNNRMFRNVVDYFQFKMPKTGAFFFLEPDCSILQKDWFSRLVGAYKAGRKPFMGVKRHAKLKTGQNLPPHINGCAFYPNGAIPIASLAPALYSASRNDHPEAAPFDVAGGADVMPRATLTNLICVDFNVTPTINPEAVLWHGDKRDYSKWAQIEKWGGDAAGRPDQPFQSEEQVRHDAPLAPESGIYKNLTGEAKYLEKGELLNRNPEPLDYKSAISKLAQIVNVSSEEMNREIKNSLDGIFSVLEKNKPANAEEAYLATLKEFGHEGLAWARAVKRFKADKANNS